MSPFLKTMFLGGIITCAFVTSNAQSTSARNRGVVRVEQIFHEWTHCNSDSKPKYDYCEVTSNAFAETQTINTQESECYIPIYNMHLSPNGEVFIDAQFIQRLTLNVKIHALKMDYHENAEYKINTLRRGHNVSVTTEQSAKCNLFKHEGYSTYTKVIVDDPIVLTPAKSNNALCIDDNDVCEIAVNDFYETNSSNCVLWFKLASEDDEKWCVMHKIVKSGQPIVFTYNDIVSSIGSDTAYYGWSGKQIVVKATKQLIDGSTSESNFLTCKFFHKGPSFKINAVRRSACSNSVDLIVEVSDNFHLYPKERYKWEVQHEFEPGQFSVESFVPLDKVNKYKLQIEDKFENTLKDKDAREVQQVWHMQLQVESKSSSSVEFSTTKFEISPKIPPIDVKQKEKPSDQPYHIYNTSDPYVVLEIKDEDHTEQGRLPYRIMSHDKTKTLSTIGSQLTFSDETVEAERAKYYTNLESTDKEAFMETCAKTWYEEASNELNRKTYRSKEEYNTLAPCESCTSSKSLFRWSYSNSAYAIWAYAEEFAPYGINENSVFGIVFDKQAGKEAPVVNYSFATNTPISYDGTTISLSLHEAMKEETATSSNITKLTYISRNGSEILTYNETNNVVIVHESECEVRQTVYSSPNLISLLKTCSSAYLRSDKSIIVQTGKRVTLFKFDKNTWSQSLDVTTLWTPSAAKDVVFFDTHVTYKATDGKFYKQTNNTDLSLFLSEFKKGNAMVSYASFKDKWEKYKKQRFYIDVLSKQGYQVHSSELKINENDALWLVDNDGCEYEISYFLSANDGIKTNVTITNTPTSANSSDGTARVQIIPGGTQDVYYNGKKLNGQTDIDVTNLHWGDNQLVLTDKDGKILRTLIMSVLPNVTTEVTQHQTCKVANGRIYLSGADIGKATRWRCHRQEDALAQNCKTLINKNDGFNCLSEGTYVVEGLFGGVWVGVGTEIIKNEVFSAELLESSPADAIGGNGFAKILLTHAHGCVEWEGVNGTSPRNSQSTYTFSLPKGSYQIIATDESGCPATTSLTIGGPSADASISFINDNGTLQVDVAGWAKGLTNPEFVLRSGDAELARGPKGLSYKTTYESGRTYSVVLEYDGAQSPYIFADNILPLNIESVTSDASDPDRCLGRPGKVSTAFNDANSVIGDGVLCRIGQCEWAELTDAKLVDGQDSIVRVSYQTQKTEGRVFMQAIRTDELHVAPGKSLNVHPELEDVTCHGMSDGAIVLQDEVRQNGAVWLRMGDRDFKDGIIPDLPAGEVTYSVVEARCPDIADERTTSIGGPDAPLAATIKTVTHPTCADNDGGVIFDVVGGWSGHLAFSEDIDKATAMDSVGNYGTSSRTLELDGLSHGRQSFTILDAGGCEVQVDATLREYISPSVTAATPTAATCNGLSDGAISIDAVDVDCSVESLESLTLSVADDREAPYAPQIEGLPAGIYALTVTDSKGCTGKPFTVQVAEPEALMVEARALGNGRVTHKGGNDGRAEIIVRGGNDGHKTVFADAHQTMTPTGVPTIVEGLPAGVVNLSASDAKGCRSNASQVTFVEPEQALGVEVSSTSALCHAMTGSVTAQATGGWGGYAIRLVGERETRNVAAHDVVTFNGLYAGDYTLVVTDREGAQVTQTVRVEAPEPISHELTTAPDACDGDGSATIQITGGTPDYASLVSNSADTIRGETISMDGLRGGREYELTTRDANNCVSRLTFAMPDGRMAVSIAGTYDAVGVTLDANVAGGAAPYSYTWRDADGGTIMGRDVKCEMGRSGIVSLEVSDANGCTRKTMRAIMVEGSLPMEVVAVSHETGTGRGDGSAVIDTDAQRFASIRLYHLESDTWTDVSTTADRLTLSGLRPGLYCVEGATTEGANRYAQFEIEAYEPMAVAKIDVHHVSATGRRDGRVVLDFNGGMAPFTVNGGRYEVGHVELAGLPAGELAIVVSDSTGNILNVNTEILEPEPLDVVASEVEDASCHGYADGWVSLSALGGWGDYQFSGGDGLFGNGSHFGALTAGARMFHVVDMYGVTDSVLVTVGQPGELRASVAAIDSVSCHGLSDGAAHFDIVGGSAPYRVTYDNETLDGTLVSALSSGSFTMTFTDGHMCKSADTITIVIPEPDELRIADSEITHTTCGTDNGSISIHAVGGSLPYKYDWTEDGSPFSSSQNISALRQNGLYDVTVRDLHDCLAKGEFRVNASRRTTIEDVLTRDASCFGYADGVATIDSASIRAGVPASTYKLLWPQGFADVMGVNTLTAGTYSVRLVDSNLCEDSARFVIGQPAAVTVNIGDDRVICPGNSLVLDAGVHHAYDWRQDGTPVGDGRYLAVDEAGAYSVEVRDETGCFARDTMTLGIGDDALEAIFLMSTEVAVGDTVALIELSNMTIDSLRWDFDTVGLTDVTPSSEKDLFLLRPEMTGTQYITMWAYANGCVASETKELDVFESLDQETEWSLGYNPLIVSARATPNPSNGEFELIVDLREVADIEVDINHVSSAARVVAYSAEGSDHYVLHFDVRQFGKGLFVLSLRCGSERRVAKLLVK